jgi:hypothetical protein
MNGDVVGLDMGGTLFRDFSSTNVSTLYINGSCSGCTWGNLQYAGGATNWSGVGTIFASPDAPFAGGVWNGTNLMEGTDGSSQNAEPGDYGATSAHNSLGTHEHFQWIAPYYHAPSANATYDTTGAVINHQTAWGSTSNNGGRIISGNDMYITSCSSGTAPNCVHY